MTKEEWRICEEICKKAFRQNHSVVRVTLLSGHISVGLYRGCDIEESCMRMCRADNSIVDLPFVAIRAYQEVEPFDLLIAYEWVRSTV